jgi:hypothetical protein
MKKVFLAATGLVGVSDAILAYTGVDSNTFTYEDGDSLQIQAYKACVATYGNNCASGMCGNFRYYYNVNHGSDCHCTARSVGTYEWIYQNYGYSQVGQDYGGYSTDVSGDGSFVRVKTASSCSPSTWTLAEKNFPVLAGCLASFAGYEYEYDTQMPGESNTGVCATGYEGTASTITCQNDYSYTDPTGCSQIMDFCPPVYYLGYTFGDAETTYGATGSVESCMNGYTGTASGTATCTEDGSWDYSSISGCSTEIDCGEPSLGSGFIVAEGTTVAASIREVTCAEGYEGEPGSIECLEDGSWSAHVCELGSCGEPNQADGYAVDSDSDSTFVGDTRVVQCAVGYQGAEQTITCQVDYTWTAMSGCTIVDCGEVSLDAGYMLNEEPSATTYGETLDVVCEDNYEGDGTDVTCQADGTWTSLTGCTEIVVEPEPEPTHGGSSVVGGDVFEDAATMNQLGAACLLLLVSLMG